MTRGLLVLLAAGVLSLAGCGKSPEAKSAAVPPGVIDLSRLQQAFPAPTPEVMNSLNKLRLAARYRQLALALAELHKLSQLPNLTEPQKQAVSNTIGQVEVAIKSGPATPSR